MRLWAYSLYGAILSAAGLPIYIYAPKFYADSYGVSLTALASVLFGLRLLDVAQDPAFGWLADRLGRWRRWVAGAAAAVLAGAMLGLFALPPALPPLVWFAITVTALFSAFSLLSILFYARGVAKASALPGGHEQLAGWRETGALLGVCIAAVTPTLLMGVAAAPFAVFAVGYAAIVAVAAVAMSREWTGTPRTHTTPVRVILADPLARRLLLLSLVNAAPLAVTSTLFLFYVESVLMAPGGEGPLLVLFFLAAGLSAPLWSRLAARFGPRRVLMAAMAVAMASFSVTLTLGAGDVALFTAVSVIGGAAIGADLTLMPAMFARRMADIAPQGGQGFGLWALTTKLTLALAAVALLPTLEQAGFRSGTDNPAQALDRLRLLYGGVPVALKLLAMGVLFTLPSGQTAQTA